MENKEEIQNREELELVTQLAECKDQYMHLRADMENMRKRNSEAQRSYGDMAQKQIFLDLLPIIDNFERALETLEKTKPAENMVSGIMLIHSLFKTMLKKYGITEIVTTGDFDPELHEAIAQVTTANKTSGSIVQVFEKGYSRNGHVLRPAKVSVAA